MHSYPSGRKLTGDKPIGSRSVGEDPKKGPRGGWHPRNQGRGKTPRPRHQRTRGSQRILPRIMGLPSMCTDLKEESFLDRPPSALSWFAPILLLRRNIRIREMMA